MVNLNLLRNDFEKLDTVLFILGDKGIIFSNEENKYTYPIYTTFVPEEIYFLNGAWYAYQESFKKQLLLTEYVLVPKDTLYDWYCMANRSQELGCPECFESRGYAHNLAEELRYHYDN